MIEGKGSLMVQLSDVFFSAGVSLYYYQLPQLPDTIVVIHINISGHTKTHI